jgi:hypothetical protein
MTLAAFLAFMEANGATILAIWIVFEQWLANSKFKSNSTLQLVVNIVRKLLGKYEKTDAGSQGS